MGGNLPVSKVPLMHTQSGSVTAGTQHIPPMSSAPAGFSIDTDLPPGFAAFYRPLHDAFTPRQQAAIEARHRVLADSQNGRKPQYLAPSDAQGEWRIDIPDWVRDQRNQMTGPADDLELGVKMLNSGAPGVMIDLEDSMANDFAHTLQGIDNTIAMYYGELTYVDQKRGGNVVGIKPSNTVLWTRVRGLHLSQAGIYPEPTSAALFDLALLAYKLDFSRLKHPLAIYIPKSQSADEALWWRDVFQAVAKAKGLEPHAIKAMALVEAFPFAYQIEEFAYNLRDHLLGLNLGPLGLHGIADPLQLGRPRLGAARPQHDPARRRLLPEPARAHPRGHATATGCSAIGGMTALFPDRSNPELNARALATLEKDKRNESDSLFDGAWTGHPDQNAIAVAQFPAAEPRLQTQARRERDARPAAVDRRHR